MSTTATITPTLAAARIAYATAERLAKVQPGMRGYAMPLLTRNKTETGIAGPPQSQTLLERADAEIAIIRQEIADLTTSHHQRSAELRDVNDQIAAFPASGATEALMTLQGRREALTQLLAKFRDSQHNARARLEQAEQRRRGLVLRADMRRRDISDLEAKTHPWLPVMPSIKAAVDALHAAAEALEPISSEAARELREAARPAQRHLVRIQGNAATLQELRSQGQRFGSPEA